MRTAFGRSFSKVTVVSGSGHFAGFIGQYEFLSGDQGVTPAFKLDDGLPPYPPLQPAAGQVDRPLRSDARGKNEHHL